MPSDDQSLEKMGRGTSLQAKGERRIGRQPRSKDTIANRIVVVLRLPVRLALQAERDRVNPDMTMSKFLREYVVKEWLEDRGYTIKGMQREAMKYAIALETERLAAEEDETA